MKHHDHNHSAPPALLNRIFAFLYDFLIYPLEKFIIRQHRKSLLKDVRGKVLEVGSGTGANFPFYHKDCEVLATEPDPVMRKQAEKKRQKGVRSGRIQANIQISPDPIEKLSSAYDDHFDYVVSTLVFCSIENLANAMKEMHRVIHTNGKIVLFEHVKSTNRFVQKLFMLMNPVWTPTMGGCRLGQDTQQVFRDAGFQITEEHYYMSFLVRFTAVATEPG